MIVAKASRVGDWRCGPEPSSRQVAGGCLRPHAVGAAAKFLNGWRCTIERDRDLLLSQQGRGCVVELKAIQHIAKTAVGNGKRSAIGGDRVTPGRYRQAARAFKANGKNGGVAPGLFGRDGNRIGFDAGIISQPYIRVRPTMGENTKTIGLRFPGMSRGGEGCEE